MQYYIHYVPGRMRIQTPFLHQGCKAAGRVEQFMRQIAGITAVEVHAATGSAILHFDEKKINCEQIIGILETQGYFCLGRAETADQLIEKTTEQVLDVAKEVIIDSLGGVGEE